MKSFSFLFAGVSAVVALSVEKDNKVQIQAVVPQEDEQILLQNALETIGTKDGKLKQGMAKEEKQILLQNALETIGVKDGKLKQGMAKEDEQVLLQNALE